MKGMIYCIILGAFATLPLGCAAPEPLRVMSFNIRYANAGDGENRWENRRPAALAMIRTCAPDVLGLQEVLAGQAAELRAGLPEYDFVGVGRDDGADQGEFVPIMYRRQLLELVEAGHFWLSETPQNPGSIGWDAALPRMATWVRLRWRDAPSRQVRVINVHLDHQGARARTESARLLRQAATAKDEPLIIVGDFNSDPGSEPYQVLVDPGPDGVHLHDAAAVSSGGGAADGTYHAFTGQPRTGRIDWILVNDRFRVLSADIHRTSFDGRYPSDHFPVSARIDLNRATRGNPCPCPAE